MNAIYRGSILHVEDDYGDGLVLEGDLRVSFGDRDLIVDPTDDQIVAAREGQPIPPDPDDMLVIGPDGSETYLPRDLETAKVLLDLGATLVVTVGEPEYTCDDCRKPTPGPEYYTFGACNDDPEAMGNWHDEDKSECTGALCPSCAGPYLEPDLEGDPRRPTA